MRDLNAKTIVENLAVLVVLLGMTNFFWFFAESVMRFGSGDALSNGSVVAGHYLIYEKAHGSLVEVSQADWDWSRLHAASVWFFTFPLTVASMLYLNFSAHARARFGRGRSATNAAPTTSDEATGQRGTRPDTMTTFAMLAGLAFNLALVGFGIVWAVPTLGLFGWIWTAGGAAIFVVNARKFLSERTRR